MKAILGLSLKREQRADDGISRPKENVNLGHRRARGSPLDRTHESQQSSSHVASAEGTLGSEELVSHGAEIVSNLEAALREIVGDGTCRVHKPHAWHARS